MGILADGSQVSTTAGIVGAAWVNPAKPNLSRPLVEVVTTRPVGSGWTCREKEQESVGGDECCIL